jgi:endoglucanase
VDAALSRGFYTIVNAHHESWFDLTSSNYTAIEEQFYNLWYQIGSKLGCKSSLLAFEPINEPGANTADQIAELNKIQSLFIKALADSGGFNAQRVVTLIGPGEGLDIPGNLVVPTNLTNPYALQFHYYSPYEFIFQAWGETIWGSDSDKQGIDTDLSEIRNNYTNIPLVMGEWDANPVCEPAARWKYFDYIIRTARKYNITPFLWDAGSDLLNRTSGTWTDPTAYSILINAANGKNNSLPDSTEDGGAATQSSSAYVWHHVGESVVDTSIPYLFNGNTLKSIKGPSGTLSNGKDYTVSGSNITFKASYLQKYFKSGTSDTPGQKAVLQLTFSSGGYTQAKLVAWDTPVLATTKVSASSVGSNDLRIPITYKGVAQVAAVQATLADGTFAFDSWTQWLGALQKGRTTAGSQYNQDSQSVTITNSAIQTILSGGQDANFTIEFFPRLGNQGPNAVNVTVTAN